MLGSARFFVRFFIWLVPPSGSLLPPPLVMTSRRPTPPSRPRSAPAGLRLRPSLVLFALFATPALANSTCLNYGIVGSSSCACPPGFTGADCSDLACGNPLLSQSSRPVFDIATAGSDGSVGCGSQCTAGFSGPSCNICTAASACTAASSLNNGGSAFGDVTCSVSGWAWTESFSSCDVIVSAFTIPGEEDDDVGAPWGRRDHAQGREDRQRRYGTMRARR